MFEVNAVELHEALIKDLKVGLTPMVASSPGMGKSDIIRSIAKEFSLKVIDLRVSQCEPVDMQGYPGVINGRMTFHIPEYFPIEGDPLPDGKLGWLLFLDEFNSGNKQTEAAAYKLILDRAVYTHQLHPRCLIAAAGNLTTDRAIVNTQSTATTSRLNHYRMRIDHKVWVDWANANDIDHRIISLIKFKPELLHKFNPGSNELTFPCPRTWEFASKVIKTEEKIDRLTTIRLAGTVGEGAAVELTTYSEIYQNLPTIEQILSNPKSGWKVPKEPSEQYAITTMLAHNCTDKTIDKIIVAINRLPVDFQVITFKDIYKRSPDLKGHPLIKTWIAENSSIIF
ncbi:ATP-binding protein [bacterium]|nr:ATP-binding protein [bacterium]